MKRFVLMILLVITVLAFSACSGSESSSGSHSEKEKHNQEESDNSEKGKQEKNNEYDIDFTNLKPGGIIQFGTYEQDNVIENGPEQIEWQVIDIQYGKIFVMSRYALDCQPLATDENEYTWDKSSLRTWLNDDFYNQAFSAKEKDRILTTKVTTEYKDIITTEDKVFLLDTSEKNHYLKSLSLEGNASTLCYPTEYAVERGVKASEKTENRCNWLLRNAKAADNARYVSWKRGDTDSGADITSSDKGIRPAMWLSYENVSLKDAEVGDIVFFGTIEQSTRVYDDEGIYYHFLDEPIAWIVLDVQDGKKLLTSKDGIFAKTYGEIYGKDPVTWETSWLRKELNSTFYDSAFSDEEKLLIKETNLTNPDNDVYGTDGGNDTTDNVFILSLPEVEKYFGGSRTEDNPRRSCYATEALNRAGTNGYGNYCSWYTRTPGQDQKSVVFVDYYNFDPLGKINMEGCDISIIGMCVARPTIWVQP